MAMAEAQYDGWLRRLPTHSVRGLDQYEEMLEKLTSRDAIKVYCEVAPMPSVVRTAPRNQGDAVTPA
jgi:hypothetical protein